MKKGVIILFLTILASFILISCTSEKALVGQAGASCSNFEQELANLEADLAIENSTDEITSIEQSILTIESIMENLGCESEDDKDKVDESLETTGTLSDGDTCSDNSDCLSGACINMVCDSLDTYFDTARVSSCDSVCKLYTVDFTIYHTLENYTEEFKDLSVGSKRYTAAASVDWQIENIGSYCENDETYIPFIITKKYDGQEISEERVVIQLGVDSQPITHPYLDSVNFVLNPNSAKEFCSG